MNKVQTSGDNNSVIRNNGENGVTAFSFGKAANKTSVTEFIDTVSADEYTAQWQSKIFCFYFTDYSYEIEEVHADMSDSDSDDDNNPLMVTICAYTSVWVNIRKMNLN